MLKHRRSRLTPFFERDSLGCIIIQHTPNIRYLSGFTGSEASLVITPERVWFISDSRYTLQAESEVYGCELIESGKRLEAIVDLQSRFNWGRIGFEACHTSVASHAEMLSALLGAELVPLGADLDLIRNCKDASELDALETAAVLASEAMKRVLPLLKPGVVESEIALALEFEMRRSGAEGRGFDFIVASGERGAMPHGRASSRVIRKGEFVTLDYGLVLAGYHSDETITVSVGGPDLRQQEVYDTVLAAHDMAISAIRPGASCRDVDAVARDYIASRGFGSYFGHGLGHGVGLEIHEKPVLSPRSDAILEEGMVVTVEPGIYIPEWGGVRIEDTVAVTAEGCRLLTSFPKEMITV